MLDCFTRITPGRLHRAYVFTGSVGPFQNDFRYRCQQDSDNKQIHAATYSRLCFELAADAEKRDFSWDEEGVAQLRQWLQNQYEKFIASQS